MKKERITGFFAGVAATLILMTCAVPSLAASLTKTVDITYSNIKIYMEGSLISPKDAKGNTVEPFAYNGTVYLPVRAVGEALGKEVTWDGTTQSVYLGAKPGASGYSRTNPAPVGTAQTISYSDSYKTFNATIKVLEVVSGDAAWKMLQAANMYNEKPQDGDEYIIAKINATLNTAEGDKAITFTKFNFTPFSSQNVEYPVVFAVDPEPSFYGDVYAGGSITGYITVEVSKTDPAPKIAFGRNSDGSGGIWFSIRNP